MKLIKYSRFIQVAILPILSVVLWVFLGLIIVISTWPILSTSTFSVLLPKCVSHHPDNWVVYRISDSDSLPNLAVKTQTQVATIKQANCLSSDSLEPNTEIFLPAVLGVTIEEDTQLGTTPLIDGDKSPMSTTVDKATADADSESKSDANAISYFIKYFIKIALAAIAIALSYFIWNHTVDFIQKRFIIPHALIGSFRLFYLFLVGLLIWVIICRIYGAIVT